ncbi:VPDSG-CTERM sorting domain-containing protein [Pelagicoccus mobilis]|uniref:VPDSG-CTERM sorting domain-containing protein n=1 Tax=Pelagicoccus mobilis TaxID=415221 RepID=A0A934RVZ9_9BACT|nr:VPDSG-CTERM sorting domain-containing protein [Pelagicoccus mobilis]MBK1876480.1 VPDSG-CTERM sorting domain-containing protein [Pelagicoccus mobilis]
MKNSIPASFRLLAFLFAAIGFISTASAVSFTVTQVGSSFDDFQHKEGYTYNGYSWKDNTSSAVGHTLLATFNLNYDPSNLAAGFSGAFQLGYYTDVLDSSTLAANSLYTATLNPATTVVGVTGDYLYFQAFRTTPSANPADAAFTGSGADGDNVYNKKAPFTLASDTDERYFEFSVKLNSGSWAGLANNILDPTADIKEMKGLVGWAGWETKAKDGNLFAGGKDRDENVDKDWRSGTKVNASGKFAVGSLQEYAVPDASSTLLMLGFAFAGLLGLRKYKARRN